MAKANKKARKPAQPAKVKFEDQFYPSGKPYIVHEVDQNGNGVLKVYSEDEVLNSERKITNYKVDLRHLKLYETDEQGRLIVTLCELYEEKKVRFALAFYEDQLIEASVFDRFGMSVVPWAVFDEDGQVNFDEFHYNFDRMPVYAADDATFEEYSNSEEGENDAAQLRIELAKDDAEASHKILEDEAAFTALLRHNLDLFVVGEIEIGARIDIEHNIFRAVILEDHGSSRGIRNARHSRKVLIGIRHRDYLLGSYRHIHTSDNIITDK